LSHIGHIDLIKLNLFSLWQDSLLRHPSLSSEVPQELPNIIEGVPAQDLELAANFLIRLQIVISQQSQNLVAINELQCQYLLEKFGDTLTGAKACIQDASLQHVQESHNTLNSLARLAKEAENLFVIVVILNGSKLL